ncbi:MAG: (2Fe-2S)-binding protein [Spirochaetes bacterium]|nr:(2Fe-2S)-binding protein [Spirochaetota bacterium]MBU1081478.1 (2Fe-2S)-binding protein [Spirochaetota bacterium]
MPGITLTYVDGRRVEFEASPVVSVLVAAQRAGVALRHDCGGKAACGTCRVRVESGVTSPKTDRERHRLEAVGAGADERLACQARAGSDLRLAASLALGGPAVPGEPEGGRA